MDWRNLPVALVVGWLIGSIIGHAAILACAWGDRRDRRRRHEQDRARRLAGLMSPSLYRDGEGD